MSWETARARHVNWVRLKDKNSGKIFRVLNTHFDHVSELAKQKAAEMIVEESNLYPENFPQILAGDFNSDVTSSPIKTLITRWVDTYSVLNNNLDPGFTTHGFIGPLAKTKKGKVDFILYRGPIKATDATVIKDNKEGVYPSDHFFVSAELQLQ
jgi:endonuclease/exonuclease/phosphatase family metal-dependent hydrolase